MKRIIWLDVETTGLDPREDYLLEVAAQATDEWGYRAAPMLHAVVAPSSLALRRLRFGPDADVVVQMHTDSGLLEAMEGGEVVSEDTALRMLEDYIEEHAQGARPGGRNVHYDLRVLDELAPSIRGALSHRHVDVSTVEMLVEIVTGVRAPRGEEAAHRAVADVEREIDRWRWALGMLGQCAHREES